ncbi:MAG: hypothetical protein FWG28_07255 [Clostridiales bacterium]|nr:hypothetical protein [Clostridiales bacterium]
MADLKTLTTFTAVSKGGSALIKKMMDCDTPKQSFELLKASGFQGTYQTFQADLKELASQGLKAGIAAEVTSFAAMCCEGYSDFSRR